MENQDQEAQHISSPSNVSLVDVQAPESGAADMQNDENGFVKEEGCAMAPLSKREAAENGSFTQDDTLPVQPPLHHHNESASTQAKLEHDELNEVENVADNTPLEVREEEGSMRKEVAEGEAQAQVEQEPNAESNEGECSADVASMDSIENVESLADSNAPVQIEHEPKLVSSEVECAASGASVIPMQQEEELVQDETLPQMEQQVVTLDDGGTEEKESCSDSSKQIEYPAIGSNEGESAGTSTSIDTVQKEAELVEEEAPIQVEEETEAGLNEGECTADDSPMGIAPVQIEKKPEVGLTEGECTADDPSTVTSHEDEASGKGEAHVQIGKKDYAGLDEGEGAANDDACLGDREEATDPIVEFSGDACEVLVFEAPIEAEQRATATQDTFSCFAAESQEHSKEDNRRLAVLEDEHELRNQDSHACEVVEGDDDVKADSTEFPAVMELNENADHQFPRAAAVDDTPAVPKACESVLIQEPTCGTPAIDSVFDQHSDGDETHEEKAGNNGQSDFTNALDGGQEMEKELSRELPDVSMQDLEMKQPTAQEGLPYAKGGLHMKASLTAEVDPEEGSLATADEKQYEALKNEELGLDPLVTEQTSKGEGEVAVLPMLVEENGDGDSSAVGEGALNKLERIPDIQLNGKVESSSDCKAANRLPLAVVENGDYHNVGEAELECKRGRRASANKFNSAQNGLFEDDLTVNIDKHNASEQINGGGQIETPTEEGTNAAECEETMGVAHDAEASMDAAVPLSSMVQENGFLHDCEDNMLRHDKKSREISQFSVVPQQKGKGSEGLKQKDEERANGNMALVRRSTWWGCCGMLDALLHKG